MEVGRWKTRNARTTTKRKEAILCAILHDNAALDSLTLEPRDFHDGQHKAIFEAMLVLRESGRGVDRVTAVRCNAATPGRYRDDGKQAGRAGGGGVFCCLRQRLCPDCRRREDAPRDRCSTRSPDCKTNSSTVLTRASFVRHGTELAHASRPPRPQTELFTRPSGNLLDMEEDKPIAWAIHEMLPRGSLTIVAAEPGAGKSTWLRSMAVSVGARQRFSGPSSHSRPCHYGLFPGRVLKPWSSEHMRKMGATHGTTPYSSALIHSSTMLLSQLRVAIERIKPALVIVDPAAKIPSIWTTSTAYGQVSPAMDELGPARTSRGTEQPFYWLQHVRTRSGRIKRPGGSIAFAASADVILHIAVEGPERRRVLTGVKNRFDERYLLQPTVIKLDHETGHMMEDGIPRRGGLP